MELEEKKKRIKEIEAEQELLRIELEELNKKDGSPEKTFRVFGLVAKNAMLESNKEKIASQQD